MARSAHAGDGVSNPVTLPSPANAAATHRRPGKYAAPDLPKSTAEGAARHGNGGRR